jgi:trichodiene synthase
MGKSFPTNYYVETIARFLDTIKYEDTNYTHKERIDRLHYAYSKTAEHFAQPQQQAFLTASPQRLQASLQTIVAMVVYSWTKITPELCAELSIHYTYTLILDDTINDPNSEMQTFYDDLLSGKQQKNGWWKLVNEHFPKLLKHYGPFCGLNLVRSTIDCK